MPAAALYRARPNAYGRGKHFPRDILTPDFVRSCIELINGELVWRQRPLQRLV